MRRMPYEFVEMDLMDGCLEANQLNIPDAAAAAASSAASSANSGGKSDTGISTLRVGKLLALRPGMRS